MEGAAPHVREARCESFDEVMSDKYRLAVLARSLPHSDKRRLGHRLHHACGEIFTPLLWLKIHELLGRVPEGSTARLIQDSTMPDENQGSATAYRPVS
jgi:hypothetical protein